MSDCDAGAQTPDDGESPEVMILQRLIAVRGRALLNVFDAHGVDIVDHPPRLVFHLADEAATEPIVTLPTTLRIADPASDTVIEIPCEATTSPPASPE